jgi:hypothetical protein
MEIKDCVFKGVDWDKSVIETVDKVAQGLLNLTELFKSQNINIEAMLKIEQPQTVTELPEMTEEKIKKLSKSVKKNK